jgi:LysM repeat protein
MFAKFLILLTMVALIVGMAARSSHGAGRERVYVVKPADTLWTIAAHNYAGDPRAAIWKLEHRNKLASDTLVPGQKLVLP